MEGVIKGNGVVVQAGPEPVLVSVELDSEPAIYVLPNALFKPLLIPEIDALHFPSKDGEPRISGPPGTGGWSVLISLKMSYRIIPGPQVLSLPVGGGIMSIGHDPHPYR